MLTPFDEKSSVARALDRLALHLAALLFSLALGAFLYQRTLPALLGGGALFIAFMILLSFCEKVYLQKTEAALRRRIGGLLGIEALSLMQRAQANAACAEYLGHIAPLESIQPPDEDGVRCVLHGKSVLIRCELKASDETAGTGTVLAALRAQKAAAVDRAVLCTTTHFSRQAAQLAEQAEPPVHLVDASVLSAIYGRLHPATDEQLAALGKRKRSPFAWPRLKLHVFSPGKKKRYLIGSLTLMLLFLLTDRLYYFFPSLLCFLLALGAHRAAQIPFRL